MRFASKFNWTSDFLTFVSKYKSTQFSASKVDSNSTFLCGVWLKHYSKGGVVKKLEFRIWLSNTKGKFQIRKRMLALKITKSRKIANMQSNVLHQQQNFKQLPAPPPIGWSHAYSHGRRAAAHPWAT